MNLKKRHPLRWRFCVVSLVLRYTEGLKEAAYFEVN